MKSIFSMLWLFLIIASCDQERPVHTTVMPTVMNTQFKFAGYVTNEKKELVSQIYYFERVVVGTDTMAGQPVFIYAMNGQQYPYYTDVEGTVWQYSLEDVTGRLATYGLITEKPVVLRYWQPLLKISQGRRSRWQVKVDTTFTATDLQGKPNTIRFLHYGEARYDGWTDVTVPERKKQPYRAMNAFWPVLNTIIVNETTGDSIFVSRGTARQLFEPQLGAIRYLTDFVYREKDTPLLTRKGTWELAWQYIPQHIQ